MKETRLTSVVPVASCSFGERAEGENRQGGPAAGGTRGLVRELWKKEPSIRRGGQLESLVGLG